MSALLNRLRADPGTKTFGELIQEREAAANEIERLSLQLSQLGSEARSARLSTQYIEAPRSAQIASARMSWRDCALLRMEDVTRIVGLSRSTIYGRMAEGTFPRSLQVSERAVRWRSADIAAWLSDLSR